MLPQETSIRQLKMLRKLSKGTDIGDITTKDRLNKAVPNMQAIGNPVDTGIESWQEFSQKDSQLQTIAFKSKLVNKSIVNKNKSAKMNEKTEDIQKFDDFNDKLNEDRRTKERSDDYLPPDKPYNPDNITIGDSDLVDDEEFIDGDFKNFGNTIKYFDDYEDFDNEELLDDEEIVDEEIPFDDELPDDEELANQLLLDEEGNLVDESVHTFDSYMIQEGKKDKKKKSKKAEKVKEDKQPEYEMLGKEKEIKSNPNFGVGAVKASEIKKITDLNILDPETPKERPILNSGQYIDNGVVNGQINRIEGKDVYVESADEPGVINKHTINDILKIKKEDKEDK